MSNYKIYATLYAETRTGSVWHYSRINTRLMKITNLETKKSIVVANRKIDENFKALYNADVGRYKIIETDNPLIIDQYYRDYLGIENTQVLVNINIEKVGKFSIGNLIYLAKHPNDSIRISFYLSVISIVISCISLLPTVIQLVCKA